uniref:NADH-ubiquinone oxidoreductase chain 1 n=2 Tax=Meloidogyne graminicola TaxID=189291 RepID=A0A059TA85_9BILA|nr:NADH dehydrogenase subunit 1 [Meloidogyne graminicola]AHN16442.1 NADH dehydrogenase subunit 1 [Meloidogyne graminicola]AUX81262.1 NADH dehydrogenase subunit 1 [Meloidogyne graminicola]
MLLYNFVFFIILILCISLLTLLERYYLAFSQIRLGPSKVFFMGSVQMIFDGLKLFFSEYIFLLNQENLIFFLMPLFSFFMMLLSFFLSLYYFNFVSFNMNFFWLFIFLGMMVFFLIMISYFSKSKYSEISSLRSSSIMVSFDMVFIFFCLILFIIMKDLCFNYYVFIFMLIVFYYLILMIILVDLNRGPFDFLEGESELVSGFNLELSSFFFVFYFLSEYGFIYFFSYFLMLYYFNYIFFFVNFFLIMFFRLVYPRYRYDLLMFLCWFILLWITMIWIFLFMIFKKLLYLVFLF